jgi:hypothetical protein
LLDLRQKSEFWTVIVGGVASWPTKVVIAVVGFFVGAINHNNPAFKGKMANTRIMQRIFIRFPPPLLIFISFPIQTYFLLVAFDSSDHKSLAFQTVACLNIIGFVIYILHLFTKKAYIKNFSSTLINPIFYASACTFFALLSAILMHLLYTVVFFETVPDINSFFNATKAIASSSNPLNILSVFNDATNFRHLMQIIQTRISEITPLTILDWYFGLSIVASTFQLARSIFFFARDDEDYMSVAVAYISLDDIASAEAVLARINDQDHYNTIQAVISAYKGEVDGFAKAVAGLSQNSRIMKVSGSSKVAEVGILSLANTISYISFEKFCINTEGYWLRNTDVTGLLLLVANYLFYYEMDPAEELSAKESYSFFAEMEEVSQLPIGEFATVILDTYGETQIGVALIVASSILEAEAKKKPHERDESYLSDVKNSYDIAVTAVAKMQTAPSFSVYIVPMLYISQSLYKKCCGTNSPELDAIIGKYEQDLTARDRGIVRRYWPLRSFGFGQ